MFIGKIFRLLIGNPLQTEDLETEKLTKRRGLAIMSSDALSSTAYATEETLRVLVLAGAAGFAFTLPVSMAIVFLITIVGFSYYRTIFAYPQGGGAYTVAHENLGKMPSLIAAAALLVDYALTVAVSICAGVAAITSAFPSLHHYDVQIAISFVILISIVNLRGVRESGAFFAVPTYAFLVVYGGMVFWGLYKSFIGELPPHPVEVHEQLPILHSLGAFIILKAFASGSSALTGIEAVSNGVQAFYPPQSKNASRVLIMMIVVLGTYFLGTSYLAHHLGIVPSETETVVSQIARQLVGNSFFYYIIQFVTVMILILAANTAYTGFPRLSSILAQDRFLPRQLGSMGDRLVFSNGILLLCLCVCVLIILFKADTHALIPLYMVGVFITFTLSQAGMVRFWIKEKSPRWWFHCGINGFGTLCTGVVGLVVFVVKFTDGAWITVIAVSLLVMMMLAIRKHYEEFGRQLSLDLAKPPPPFENHKVIIPVSDIHRGVLEAVRYAKSISKDVSALYVDLGNEARMKKLQEEWVKWVDDVPIVVLPSPYRSVIRPIITYLDELREAEDHETAVTVVLPEFIPVKWWHHLLHNQTAFMLRFAILFHRRLKKRYKVLADVPYYLRK